MDFKKRETLVINLFAGPGAGKTTCAWEIAEKLKKLGYVVEYVSEYAKELVWDGRTDMLDGSVKNQMVLMYEQKRRIDRLIGKVDFVVTDSPILLSSAYLAVPNSSFNHLCRDLFNAYNNFSIFIERGETFEKEGRIHTEEESKGLDCKIRSLLEENEIYFGTYRFDTIDLSIKNMQTTFNRINSGERVLNTSLKKQIDFANMKRGKDKNFVNSFRNKNVAKER